MSRELDAEVAVQLFGWARRTTECNTEQVVTVPPDWTDLRIARWLGHDVNELVPHFSTSIETAWQVLDEMVWRVGTANIRLDMEDYGRGAGTSNHGAERSVWVTIGEHTAFGPTPEAICRAALAAIGQAVG